MPLFKCSKCGCMENTALSNWAVRHLDARLECKPVAPPLCSECDPKIGVWHGEFEKVPWDENVHGPHDIERMKL